MGRTGVGGKRKEKAQWIAAGAEWTWMREGAVAICPAGWRGRGTLTIHLGSVFKMAETPGQALRY